MQYRELGKSGLKVSSMGIGCRGFGRKDVSTADCTATVKLAIDSGINFFDTADIYGDGRSEELLAKGLAGIPRDRYILATKGGSERLPGVGERQNGTPEHLRKSLEQSLRRLRTDHIDLYQLHMTRTRQFP
ncbi:MAG: aldo/keto reductase [Bacillota bacterium]